MKEPETNTNDSSDSYKCNCGQAEKFYFCYLNSNNKIDSTKEFTITQYNSRSYNSGTPFHFSDESVVFVIVIEEREEVKLLTVKLRR